MPFAFLIVLSLLLPFTAHADLTLNRIELAELSGNTVSSAEVIKKGNQYFLELKNNVAFNGKKVPTRSRSDVNGYYTLHRQILIPLVVKFTRTGGFGGYWQGLGFGDDDKVTASFSIAEGSTKRASVADLLSIYEGVRSNFGLVFIGGGRSSANSSNGIELSQNHGSILMIGPTGMPIGLNTGFELLYFEVSLSAPLKAAFVTYELSGSIRGDLIVHQREEVAESMDAVLNLGLKLQ